MPGSGSPYLNPIPKTGLPVLARQGGVEPLRIDAANFNGFGDCSTCMHLCQRNRIQF